MTPKPPITKPEKWEIEFDKEFRYIQDATDVYFNEHFGSQEKGTDLPKIKSFISDLLKQQKEQLVGRIEKLEVYKQQFFVDDEWRDTSVKLVRKNQLISLIQEEQC